MPSILKCLTILIAVSILPSTTGRAADAISIEVLTRSKPVDFATEVAPILRANCIACHHAKKTSGGLNLESPATISKGGEQGPAVVAGKSSESLLLKVAAHQQESIMPPPDNLVGAKPLTPAQLGLLKLWIDQGATGNNATARDVQFQSLPTGYQPALATAVTPDGHFAACSRGNRLTVYQMPSGQRMTMLTDPALHDSASQSPLGLAHRDLVRCLAFDSTGDLLASGGFREVKLWRRPRVTQTAEYAHEAGVQSLAISLNGRFAATAAENGHIRIWDVASGKPTQSIVAHTASVTGIAFAADDAVLFSCSLDKSLRTWSATTGEALGKAIEVPAAIHTLTVVGKGERLITGSDDGLIRVWVVKTLREPTGDASQPTHEIKAHGAAVAALAMSSRDADEFWSGGADWLVRRWNAESGKQLSEMKNDGPVVALAVRSNGQRIAASGANGVTLWTGDGKQVAKWNADPRLTLKIAKIDSEITFSKSAITLAQQDLKSYEGLIRISKVNTEDVKKAEDELAKVEKTRDEKKAAVEKAKAENGKVEPAEKALADAETAVQVAMTVIERAKVIAERTAKQLVDAEQAVTARESLLKQQETAKEAESAAAKAAPLAMRSLAFSSDGHRLAIGCEDGSLHLFDSETGAALESVTNHQSAVRAIAFGSDNKLITGSSDRRALLWNASEVWRLERVIGGQNAPDAFSDRVLSADFSRDGRWLATGGGIPSRSGELKIWNVADGQLVRTFNDAHADTVFAVRFSPDGKQLASGAADRALRIFDAQTGEAVRTLSGHTGHVLGVSWKADGKLLASCGADQLVKLWDSETGLPIQTMKGGTYGNRNYKAPVTAVSFIGDSEEILAASGDGTVRLHRTSSENEVMSFGDTKGYQFSAAATPDGRSVVAGGSDGTLRIWSGHEQRPKQTLEP